MAEAPVTTTKAPTPTAPNVPGSISNPVNPTFGADPVYIDQLNKLNFQNENFLAGDKETLANFANNYNRTLLGLEGKETAGYKALGGRDLRRFAGNYGEGLGDRQALAREYTQRRDALAERLGQNYQRVGRGIQEREGKTGLQAGEFSLAAKGRAEKKTTARPLEAPPGIAAATNAAANTPGQGGVQGYPKATAYVNTIFPGGQAEQIRFSKMSPAEKQAWEASHRAKGGPVTPGHAYIVGERGPELMVPKTPGRVVPNNRLAAIRKAAARGRRY